MVLWVWWEMFEGKEAELAVGGEREEALGEEEVDEEFRKRRWRKKSWPSIVP